MVGGYVVLSETPLNFGQNDMKSVYGSLDNAIARFNEIARCGKPVLLKIRYNDVLCVWLELSDISQGVYTLYSVAFKVTFNAGTGVLTINSRD